MKCQLEVINVEKCNQVLVRKKSWLSKIIFNSDLVTLTIQWKETSQLFNFSLKLLRFKSVSVRMLRNRYTMMERGLYKFIRCVFSISVDRHNLTVIKVVNNRSGKYYTVLNFAPILGCHGLYISNTRGIRLIIMISECPFFL